MISFSYWGISGVWGVGHWRDPPSLKSSPFVEQGLQPVSEAAEANIPFLPCVCALVCVQVFATTLCDPMDCSPPGFSVHGILQARILEWIAVTFSRGDFPGASVGKVSAYNVGDPGSIPGLGRSPVEGNGNPLQYSCLENPMDGGAWLATGHGVTKSWTRLSDFTHSLSRGTSNLGIEPSRADSLPFELQGSLFLTGEVNLELLLSLIGCWGWVPGSDSLSTLGSAANGSCNFGAKMLLEPFLSPDVLYSSCQQPTAPGQGGHGVKPSG